ncbi:MAG: hypothetical protein COS89_02785 [Deltaproteobacteria bacterium CG07_land_8_20_14_0_80_38_7]|nr:MAG: hypothetical protein COS89_02785 [Deltaproteobacteria bacterium CG07_land_8_20_14_0_80_38_7]
MAKKRNFNERRTGNVLDITDPKVYEAIKKRAYELYCKRHHTHGNDMHDWLEAEKQIRREMESRR